MIVAVLNDPCMNTLRGGPGSADRAGNHSLPTPRHRPGRAVSKFAGLARSTIRFAGCIGCSSAGRRSGRAGSANTPRRRPPPWPGGPQPQPEPRRADLWGRPGGERMDVVDQLGTGGRAHPDLRLSSASRWSGSAGPCGNIGAMSARPITRPATLPRWTGTGLGHLSLSVDRGVAGALQDRRRRRGRSA